MSAYNREEVSSLNPRALACGLYSGLARVHEGGDTNCRKSITCKATQQIVFKMFSI